jgi:hypothetical protein
MLFRRKDIDALLKPALKQVARELRIPYTKPTAKRAAAEVQSALRWALMDMLRKFPIWMAKTTPGNEPALVVVPLDEFWGRLERRLIYRLQSVPRQDVLLTWIGPGKLEQLVRGLGPNLLRWYLDSEANKATTYKVEGSGDTWIGLPSRVVRLQSADEDGVQSREVIPFAMDQVRSIGLTRKKLKRYRKHVEKEVERWIAYRPPRWDGSKIPDWTVDSIAGGLPF